MIVRDEIPSDRAAVRAVHLASFPGPQEADLVERLWADGEAAIALVALADGGEVVGHVMLSPMRAPFRALGLGPVGVAPERQGTGLGAALVREALARAETQGWQGVFCLGDPAYYECFGFSVPMASGFSSPYAGPHLMAHALGAAALPESSGVIEYARAFSAFEEG